MSSFQTPIESSSSIKQSQTQESTQSPIQEPIETKTPDQETQQNPQLDSTLENQEQEEEEEGECGFCLFMKGGGCKESFVSWEKCIEDAEKNQEDIVEKCVDITAALKKCMEAHSDYYEPVLRAEKAAEAEAVEQLEKEKEKVDGEKAKEDDKA
ncbi:GCK domain-containing protein [Heracleum sosnowskyi]|uniref:GCK domain-containing protein n=1 Tax=Heracleum sosnowskyi TaxID=360622 RepID=A0AAD8J332_9APIA|nr:GCK domain-containing protein [Heracleum sosnowskyi]